MGDAAEKRDEGGAGVVQIVAASEEAVGAGLKVRRALPKREIEAVGPFVFLDHMGPTAPPEGGVPAHPHAGIEVVTYLLRGEIEHRDSLGNRSIVKAGGAQWITSGRGILHAEFPRGDADGLMEGVQLWTRQPETLDREEPRYAAVTPGEIPERSAEGIRLRLLAGAMPIYFEAPGPIRLSEPAELVHLTLEPGAFILAPLKPAYEMALYALSGTGEIGRDRVTRGDLAYLRHGPELRLSNSGETVLEALLLGGARAARPLLFRGPFVFNSHGAIERAYADYLEGRMGRLYGAPF